MIAALVLWASPVRALLALPERADYGGAPTSTGPLAEAAAASMAAERDHPVGG